MRFLPLLLAAVIIGGCAATATDVTPAKSSEPMAQQKVPVESLKASYNETKQAFGADGSDANKKAHVDATVAYATGVMAGEGVPKEKYPAAIRLYDEALALDPKNDEAKANKQLILDIYESMGKEPPK